MASPNLHLILADLWCGARLRCHMLGILKADMLDQNHAVIKKVWHVQIDSFEKVVFRVNYNSWAKVSVMFGSILYVNNNFVENPL